MKPNFKLLWNFKKLLGKGHSLPSDGPDTDWRRIFWTYGVLTLFVILAGLYVFFMVQNGSLFSVQADANIKSPRLNTTLLNKVVTYYEDRGSDFNNIQTSKEVVKDPSR